MKDKKIKIYSGTIGSGRLYMMKKFYKKYDKFIKKQNKKRRKHNEQNNEII